MELKTILAILYANGMENVVSKAVAIDNNLDKSELTVLRTTVSKERLAKGKTFANNKGSGYVDCQVIGYNQFKLDNNYLIQYPNGDTSWQSYNDYSSREPLAEIVDIGQ